MAIITKAWCGALTPNSCQINVIVNQNPNDTKLILSTHAPSTQDNLEILPSDILQPANYTNWIVRFSIDELSSLTTYHYKIVQGDKKITGQFQTSPSLDDPTSFKFLFGACGNRRASGNEVYHNPRFYKKMMAEEFDSQDALNRPLFFCHMGDLHYEDQVIDDFAETDVTKRLAIYEKIINKDGFTELFSRLPLVYTWDDHDFLGNNKGGADLGNEAHAQIPLEAYDLFVPHYPFGGSGIYQSFEVGSVLFLLTDTRYHKRVKRFPRKPRQMLGPDQVNWLKAKFLQGKKKKLIIWVNSVPWIDKKGGIISTFNPDKWGSFHDEERQPIAQFIRENEIRNICMISGDAHMLAIDNGSHSGFAVDDDGGPIGGFPVFHAAALGSSPSQKGNLYSIGALDKDGNGIEGKGIEGNTQYGSFSITEKENHELDILWEGKRYDEEKDTIQTLISHKFSTPETFDRFFGV